MFVIRNEMFQTNQPLTLTAKQLYKEMGWRFMLRRIGKKYGGGVDANGFYYFFHRRIDTIE